MLAVGENHGVVAGATGKKKRAARQCEQETSDESNVFQWGVTTSHYRRKIKPFRAV